jgi:hypothetical protein
MKFASSHRKPAGLSRAADEFPLVGDARVTQIAELVNQLRPATRAQLRLQSSLTSFDQFDDLPSVRAVDWCPSANVPRGRPVFGLRQATATPSCKRWRGHRGWYAVDEGKGLRT